MIKLYSQTTISFIQRLRTYALKILREEMQLRTGNSRIYLGNHSFPLTIVVFEDLHKLGHYNSAIYEMGINKCLLYQANSEVIKNIVRHELAHYYHHISGGSDTTPHGAEYRQICARWGWGESVYRAKSDLSVENSRSDSDLKSERVLEKIKKLLSLAQSSNVHEAELATIKANQLLLEHNLSETDSGVTPEATLDEPLAVLAVLTAPRLTSKLHAIAQILTHFLVHPIFNKGAGIVYLEVMGKKTNVELADYLANYLDHQLEWLWEQQRQASPHLKGITCKNSFFQGVAIGYTNKLTRAGQTLDPKMQKALVTMKKDLQQQIRLVYGRLRASQTAQRICSESLSRGEIRGRNLEIARALSDDGPRGRGQPIRALLE